MPGVIDADLHNAVPKIDALFPYLAPVWVEYVQQSAFKGPADTSYPKGAPSTGTDAPDLDTFQRQALGETVEVGILNCLYAVDSIHNPDSAMALARAVNDWQIAEWLDKEPRLRASIVVPSQNPTMAADEVRRAAKHSRFVQVLLPARTRAPLGNRLYRPIFEAAVDHDLVVGVHFGGSPGNPPTAAGWHSSYIEEYAAMAQVAQEQVESMAADGLFAELPRLRVAVIECGWTWLPPLMERLGADAIRPHVKLTLTPTHPPPRPGVLAEVVARLGSDEMLMYSSDYPHVHAESPVEILAGLPAETARKIKSENARSFYHL
jgi:predicted TIM-barrel fold metal-dependent hydrolase